MKTLLLIFSICCSTGMVFSQQENCACQSADDYDNFLKQGLTGREYHNPLTGYRGEHFYGSWKKGNLWLENGDTISGVDLRYEQYLDAVLWLRNSDRKTGILHKALVTGFQMVDEETSGLWTFVRRKIKLPLDADSVERYLQVLEPGRITFYAFRKAGKSPVGYSLVDASRFFLYHHGQYVMINLKRKDLLNAPCIEKAKMKAILRSNAITVHNNEQGMARAVSLYNK